MRNQGDSIRLVNAPKATLFSPAILKFPPESSGYSEFIPEKDLTVAERTCPSGDISGSEGQISKSFKHNTLAVV
jgi:hypothetical protein